MTTAEIWLLAAVALAVVVAATSAATWRVATRRRRRPLAAPRPGPDGRKVAFVVNPVKKGADRLRAQAVRRTADLGWDEPLWLTTTPDDPGYAAAREALAAHSDLVVVAGGDGTVRAVAEVLAGTRTPIAVVPTGTGNMLARNLGLDLASPGRALEVAFGGRNRRIDVGHVRWRPTQEAPGRAPEEGTSQEHVFMVMAGVGFDAAIMADTDDERKKHVGWWAYFEAGLRKLGGPRSQVALRFDGKPDVVRRVRTVVVGNCGKLPGGIELMPGAQVDDGLLDTISIAPRRAVDWGRVALRILGRARHGVRITEHFRSARVGIRADEPQAVQLDGDPVGTARHVEMWVEPAGLIVRVP